MGPWWPLKGPTADDGSPGVPTIRMDRIMGLEMVQIWTILDRQIVRFDDPDHGFWTPDPEIPEWPKTGYPQIGQNGRFWGCKMTCFGGSK